MKTINLFSFLIVFSMILMCISCTDDPISNSIKTPGSLAVSVTTVSYKGNYAPSNVLAVWVESGSGTFAKSLLVNAAIRKEYLTNWNKSSARNATDAITGATLINHGIRTCTWNGKDKSGNEVGDGVYKLCVEFTEENGTGKFESFIFNKGKVVDIQTPATKSGIVISALKWTPN